MNVRSVLVIFELVSAVGDAKLVVMSSSFSSCSVTGGAAVVLRLISLYLDRNKTNKQLIPTFNL